MRLNDRTVTGSSPALPSGKKDYTFFDDDMPGFGLRLREGGSRTWVYQYWHGERARRVTLGKYPVLSASAARDMITGVGGLKSLVGMGRDPAAEKIDTRARKTTVGEVVEQYLAYQGKRLRPRSLIEVERHLHKNAKPLHDIAIENLKRADVADLLTRLASDNGPIQSNRTRASLTAMLGWAIKAGKIEVNVAAFTPKEKEKFRDRVLTGNELAAIWHALADDDYAAIVRLLILTGQRREEIGGLCWSEIDLSRKVINLPASRTKNGRAHTVPMSEPVLAIIKAIKKQDGRDFVFGDGSGPFAGYGKCKLRLDAQLAKMPPWTQHDLRRSAATHMAEIGVEPHIVKAVLNHVSGHKGGIAGVYNHANYTDERRAALTAWGQHVLRLLAKRKRTIKEVAA